MKNSVLDEKPQVMYIGPGGIVEAVKVVLQVVEVAELRSLNVTGCMLDYVGS